MDRLLRSFRKLLSSHLRICGFWEGSQQHIQTVVSDKATLCGQIGQTCGQGVSQDNSFWGLLYSK